MNQSQLQESSLTVKGLSLRLNSCDVLKNIGFSLAPGEIATIIGPNGVGKTTLLKAIAGDFIFKSQPVQFFDERFLEMETQIDRLARAKKIAVLPQHSELQFPFSVEEVVALGRTPHSTSWQENENIVEEVMCRMHIDALKKNRYTELSGGEKQRVQLARVFAQIWLCEHQKSSIDHDSNKIAPQRFLLLDEPSAALDFQYQQSFVDILKYLAGSGVTILIASHDINLSLKYTDRFIAMYAGSIYKQGADNEIITEEVMKTLFDVEVSIVEHPKGGRILAF